MQSEVAGIAYEAGDDSRGPSRGLVETAGTALGGAKREYRFSRQDIVPARVEFSAGSLLPKLAAAHLRDAGHLRQRDADALGERLVAGLVARLHHRLGNVLDGHGPTVGQHLRDVRLEGAG